MKRVLITGAAGFIGYHLAKRLSIQHDTIGIDNLNSYYDPELKIARLQSVGISEYPDDQMVRSSEQANYRFVKIDISNRKSLDKLFNENQFDVVIHLAAQAGVRYSIENPDAYLNSNLVGFHHIIECCRIHKVGKFVFASSSSVYGNSEDIPFCEDANIDYPISLYAATKKSNELVAHAYSHLYGIKTIGLRFFTVYGEWGRPDMAYFKFVDKILKGQSIEVYHNGNLERDFTYIDDIVNGIEQIVAKNNPEEYGIYNIGNSHPINLLRFIQIIEEELGMVAQKVFMPMQPGDVYRTYANTERLEKNYGYKPSFDFRLGIRNFINWYKEFYQIG